MSQYQIWIVERLFWPQTEESKEPSFSAAFLRFETDQGSSYRSNRIPLSLCFWELVSLARDVSTHWFGFPVKVCGPFHTDSTLILGISRTFLVNSDNMAAFSALPAEILVKVLRYLDAHDLLRCPTVRQSHISGIMRI